MAVENDLLALARTDLEVSNLILGTTNDELKQNVAAYHTEQALEKIIKHLIVTKRGYSNNTHDIGRLVADAVDEGIDIPNWVEESSYEISKWSTTIRYNSAFRTNRDKISATNSGIGVWLAEIEK